MNERSSAQKIKEIGAIDAYWVQVSGVKGVGIKILRRLRRYYRQWFQQSRNHVFVKHGPFEPVSDPPCEIVRFDRFEDIPASLKEAFLAQEGQTGLATDRFEMDHGAIMWVGLVDGQLAHRKLIRYGKDFKRWFVDLKENDIVVFRANTYPNYRGLGIGPAISAHLMYSLLRNGGKVYTDCNVNNAPAIRATLKNGYEIIATMKPISREQALGIDA